MSDAPPAPPAPPTEQPPASYTPPQSQADLDRIVEQRLASERSKFADYDQLKDKASKYEELEQAKKTELEKANERAEAAERRAAENEAKALRSEVAAAKGVPASALTGSTKAELEKAADDLIAWRSGDKPKADPAQLHSGGGGGGGGAQNAKERAAAALRGLGRT